MKKLYRKGAVHPSLPIISDHLSFLPATILTLTAALSHEDREVLAYLISCSNHHNSFQTQRTKNNNTQKSLAKSKSNSSDHPPLFSCDCFRCYMSYWVKWDESPNRQLIHEIIDAFEDELLRKNNKVKKKNNNKKDKKKKGGAGNYNNNNNNNNDNSDELKRPSNDHQVSLGNESFAESEETISKDGEHREDGEEERGSVKSFVSFIGEKIWGVWG
ncbi:putative uncharacterized protein DDB_G0286333 [Mangifera indica]|uniref:putative uncharacterized protein DDB_G0286333 n=1 Tax=Mangifera indica TaxID=29780 RepID=UPI001CFC3590|nr:putative uncharacterized protein DDB_G0286333 [Mangifera indica]